MSDDEGYPRLSPPWPHCRGLLRTGSPCRYYASLGGEYCRLHADQEDPERRVLRLAAQEIRTALLR